MASDKEKMLSDGTAAPVGAESEMRNLDVEEVSLVGRPAIKRKFLVRKSEGLEVEEVELEDDQSMNLSSFHEQMEEKYLLGDVDVVWSIADWKESIETLHTEKSYDREDIISMAEEIQSFLLSMDIPSLPTVCGEMSQEDYMASALYHMILADAFSRVEKEDSFKPTASMKAAAQQGLDWRSEHGRGGTAVGIARARDIVNNKSLSLSTVKRMYSFFSRHEVDKKAEGFKSGEKGYPSNGRIAWSLWGSDSGFSWSKRIVARYTKSAPVELSLELMEHLQDTYYALLGAAEMTDDELIQVSKGKSLGTLLSNAITRKAKNRADRAVVVQQLADAAGITTEAVYMITTGKIKCPPQKRLAAFAKVLNISESSLKSAARKDGCKLQKEDTTMNKLVFDKEKQAIFAEVKKEDGSVELQEVQQEGLFEELKKHFTPETPTAQEQQKKEEQPQLEQKTEQQSDQLRKEVEKLVGLVTELGSKVQKQSEHIEKLEKAAPLSNSDEPEQPTKKQEDHLFKGLL